MSSKGADSVTVLGEPITLPCGVVLKNRFAKAALSEQLGTPDHAPSSGLGLLYGRWARGGAGTIITGNVMIDHAHLGEPRNVVISDKRHVDQLKAWATSAGGEGVQEQPQLWMQINHPGRQTPRFLDPHPVAPSAISVKLGGAFATPRALKNDEILNVIKGYAAAASIAQEAGFTGVQLHGAHGYLISQFLSPLANQRDDEWGGDEERRMRFVLELVRATRSEVGAAFPISVKLNSADFQKGGMDVAASMRVAQALSQAGIDMLEVSGGTYERPVMLGPQRDSTIAREAYFLEYATQVRKAIGNLPLMVTGGFRTAIAMCDAVASGACDVIGLGRPMTIEPDLPKLILSGSSSGSELKAQSIGIRQLNGLAEIQWHEMQMHRLASGQDPDPNRSLARVMGTSLIRDGLRSLRRLR